MHANHLFARIFDAFKAFVAQLHASLVFTTRPIRAVTFDTSSVLRQFALQFDVAVDCRHKAPHETRHERLQKGKRKCDRKEST